MKLLSAIRLLCPLVTFLLPPRPGPLLARADEEDWYSPTGDIGQYFERKRNSSEGRCKICSKKFKDSNAYFLTLYRRPIKTQLWFSKLWFNLILVYSKRAHMCYVCSIIFSEECTFSPCCSSFGAVLQNLNNWEFLAQFVQKLWLKKHNACMPFFCASWSASHTHVSSLFMSACIVYLSFSKLLILILILRKFFFLVLLLRKFLC